jgi:hypothetical protein
MVICEAENTRLEVKNKILKGSLAGGCGGQREGTTTEFVMNISVGL